MAETRTRWEAVSPWLFLAGLVLFGGSVLLFVADVIRQVAVFRGIALNAVGAVVLIAWAAYDTLTDPDSEVATAGGAAGTALLLYGLYLFGTGVVLVATSPWHDQFLLGVLSLPLAAVAVVVGFAIFPTAAVLDTAEQAADADDTPENGGTDGSETGAGAGQDGNDNT